MRSPAVSSMSSSRPSGCSATSCARRSEVVGRLAHRRDDDDDVVAGAAGAGDVIGHGSDAIGIGHRGAAEFLHEKHGNQGYRRPPCPPDRFPPVHSAPMPPADKRARKKENARAAREQREAAVKRKKRTRSRDHRRRSSPPSSSGVIVLLSVTGGKARRRPSPTTTTPTHHADHRRRGRRCRPAASTTVPPETTKPTYKSAPPMTIDTSKTYVAHVSTTCGDLRHHARRQGRARRRVNSFVFLAKQPLLRRADVPPPRQGLRDPGRRPEGRRHAAAPATTSPTEPPEGRLPSGLGRDGQRRRRAPPARSSSSR